MKERGTGVGSLMSSPVTSLASDHVGGELPAPRWHSGFLDAIVGRSRDVVIVSDPSLIVVFAAGAIHELTGWDASDIVGTDGLHLIHPDDLESSASRLALLVERPGQRSVTEARILRRDGGWVWVEVLALNLLDDPSVNGLVGQF